MTSPLSGQRMIVIGASSGVGRGLVLHAVARGATVVAVARRGELLRSLREECGCTIAELDITRPDCAEVMSRIAGDLGGVDQLLITAATVPLAPLRSMDAQTWARVFAVNCIGPNLAIAGALDHFSPDAQVIVVSSDSSGTPWHSMVGYAASKAALDDSVRGWRVEHPDLRVTCVRLSATAETDAGREMDPEVAAVAFPKWIAQGRVLANFMTVDEVAIQLLGLVEAGILAPRTTIDAVVLHAKGGLMRSATPMIESVVENNEQRSSNG